MNNNLWRLLIAPVLAVIVFGAAYIYFYAGGAGYSALPTPEMPVSSITAAAAPAGAFEDKPKVSRGTLVVDGLHGNAFSKAEASVFLGLVTDRGYNVDIVGEASRFGGFGSEDPAYSYRVLEEKLRGADSLLVVLPQDPFSGKEAELVQDFVLRKGGKLLLIGDPTRRHENNSVAGKFDIAFQPDYLFNTVEYELNFQNIIVRDFLPDEITRGVGQIALYSSGSITGPGPGLAAADGNTRSSMSETPGPFYPLVRAGDGRALALGDWTFIIPPRNSVLDNNRLLANIASFLTDSQRTYVLSDFPHFFRGGAEDGGVDILLGRPALFETASLMEEAIAGARVAGAEDFSRDTVFLGLYDDAPQIIQYLQLAGVQVDGSLRTPFTADMDAAGTGVVLLQPGPDRHVMALLADTEENLSTLASLVQSGGFRDGLVGDFVGVYRIE